MNPLRQLIQLFRKPFPMDDGLVYFRNSVLLSIFITFFLYVFEPFGIGTLESDKFLICLGFGSMTLLAAMVYDLIVYRMLGLRGKQRDWTLGKWVVHNIFIMLLISLANFLFARLAIIGYIDWSLFPTMIYSTFMIGIIPIVMLGGIAVLNQERKFQKIAQEINQKNSSPFQSHEQTHEGVFGISLDQIRYVEALQNYVKIGYVNLDGQFKVQTERTTLKGLLDQIHGSPIIRCHRSFLVNQNAIVSASGNAQGLLLSLSGCCKEIPVSRSLVPVFRKD
ncbi:LytR/AlgR family response regulator transcription factor [Flagellimonas myxillae]|uniref:LytR/AlgR family response regulator transcription factor n=1 Tax=Flagellimonas myxillae TaxID=2942214 RepID=UPI00201F5BB6|nr:LytTR family DNA-binding domain-containing protein [Muricauda myxillae]MCL6266879.1 LytTR family transcriptional regulator [Muricauda myxillae]